MGVPEDKSCGVSMPVRAVPYRHQRDAFLFACGMFGILPEKRKIESQGVALLMEMGTGKTLTTIAITGALAGMEKIRRVLVVAPLSILEVWEEEFQRFAAFPYVLAVLTGPGSRKRDTLRHMTGAALQVVVVKRLADGKGSGCMEAGSDRGG